MCKKLAKFILAAIWLLIQSSSAVAQLAARKPVLLNIDYDSGHGIGSTQSSVNRDRADLISFMLWQFGVDGYAPAPEATRQTGK